VFLILECLWSARGVSQQLGIHLTSIAGAGISHSLRPITPQGRLDPIYEHSIHMDPSLCVELIER
jgi:hypothetical protein